MNTVSTSYRFANVLSIINGRNQKKVEAPQGQYPIYGSGGIMGWANDYICPENTVVIGRKGSINNPIYVDRKFWNVDTAFGLVPNRNILLPRYLFYFCVYFDFEKLNTTVTIPSLTKTNLLQIKMFLPPLEEQEKIICRLDRLCRLIELKEEQLKRLDVLAKSRFIEMFDPYSLETARAGSIMPYMRNGVSPSAHGKRREKVLTLSAVTTGYFDAKAWKEGYFVDCPPIEKRITTSDFYMCRGNGNKTLVGVGVYSSDDHLDLVFPDTVIAARIDEQKICLPYLAFAWKMPSVRNQIECSARTTNGTYKINQQSISNVRLILPPLSLQNEFASFIEELDKSKFSSLQMLNRIESFYAESYITENR